MKLWLIEQSGRVGWDETIGFVIRAKSEIEAREIANKNSSGVEESITWSDPEHSSCVELKTAGEAGVILEAFKAG